VVRDHDGQQLAYVYFDQHHHALPIRVGYRPEPCPCVNRKALQSCYGSWHECVTDPVVEQGASADQRQQGREHRHSVTKYDHTEYEHEHDHHE
jgi:hypothetical protein